MLRCALMIFHSRRPRNAVIAVLAHCVRFNAVNPVEILPVDAFCWACYPMRLSRTPLIVLQHLHGRVPIVAHVDTIVTGHYLGLRYVSAFAFDTIAWRSVSIACIGRLARTTKIKMPCAGVFCPSNPYADQATVARVSISLLCTVNYPHGNATSTQPYQCRYCLARTNQTVITPPHSMACWSIDQPVIVKLAPSARSRQFRAHGQHRLSCTLPGKCTRNTCQLAPAICALSWAVACSPLK